MEAFNEMAAEFRKCHSTPVNVSLHFVTTPGGIMAALALINSMLGTWVASCALTAIYAVALIGQLPRRLWAVNTVLLAAVCGAAVASSLSILQAIILLAVCYGGQELAHIITGEITYQSTYIEKAGGFQQLLMHTYYLLPLCLDAACHSNFLSVWFVSHNDVLTCRLETPDEKIAMKTITDWVISQSPSTEHTTHWWYDKLPEKIHAAFTTCVDSATIAEMFASRFPSVSYVVEPINQMNEIYVASDKHNLNSDTVFYMEHVDGPWVLYPFCHVYRCICAMNTNKQILTEFNNVPAKDLLSDGLVSALDFNREVHRIANHPTDTNTGHRITLKNHYVVYPKCLKSYGRYLAYLTYSYNYAARALFLSTIKTETFTSKIGAFVVLAGTKIMFVTQQYLGFPNILYLAAVALIDRFVLPNRNFFLIATSFIHYCMYMAHFYRRYGLSHGTFVRNAIFFKCVAIGQLAILYIKNFTFDPISIALLVMGYGLSSSAAAAIGLDRTYFGSEMGIYKPKWISAFPYSLGIPHPMIVGSITGLLGFYKLAGIREAFPWLVPVHVALYTAHCLQEHFEIHTRKSWEECTKGLLSPPLHGRA